MTLMWQILSTFQHFWMKLHFSFRSQNGLKFNGYTKSIGNMDILTEYLNVCTFHKAEKKRNRKQKFGYSRGKTVNISWGTLFLLYMYATNKKRCDWWIPIYSRSACSYVLKNYVDCLTDIELALEAGYPTHMVYKLYIRQCKCLLELTRIPQAQEAFDKAIDAIDRSGMKKDMRKGITADLQEAFINLAKSVEENPMPQEIQHTSNVSYIL